MVAKVIDGKQVAASIRQECRQRGEALRQTTGLITGNTVLPPCTPYGVVRILEFEKIPVEGRNAVVVGASNIVGKPMALMLMQREATVSICHAKTTDLAQYTILADILVVVAGLFFLFLLLLVLFGVVV